MIILGIDPGLNITGFGKILCDEAYRKISIIEAGVIRTKRTDSLEKRLETLYNGLSSVITDVDVVALESLFSVYKHPRTAIMMGHARGVLMLVAAQHGINVESYTPLRVKKAVSGFGMATKDQMQRAVKNRFGLKQVPKPADVSDALALALCHANVLSHQSLGARI